MPVLNMSNRPRVSGRASWTQEHVDFERRLARKTLVADIRVVSLCWDGDSPTTHLVHKDDVAAFVEASKRLHFDPGVNPGTGKKVKQIHQIDVEELLFDDPYWWTTPSLNGNDPGGACLLSGHAMTRVIAFQSPAHAAEMEALDDD